MTTVKILMIILPVFGEEPTASIEFNTMKTCQSAKTKVLEKWKYKTDRWRPDIICVPK